MKSIPFYLLQTMEKVAVLSVPCLMWAERVEESFPQKKDVPLDEFIKAPKISFIEKVTVLSVLMGDFGEPFILNLTRQVLLKERKAGREPDKRSWAVLDADKSKMTPNEIYRLSLKAGNAYVKIKGNPSSRPRLAAQCAYQCAFSFHFRAVYLVVEMVANYMDNEFGLLSTVVQKGLLQEMVDHIENI